MTLEFSETSTPFARHDGLAAELGDALRKLSFNPKTLQAFLGSNAFEALYRGEPGAVLHRCLTHDDETTSAISNLIQILLLRRPTTRETLHKVFGEDLAERLLVAGVFTASEETYQVAFDIRPHTLHGNNYIVISDLDAGVTHAIQDKEHVLGVGAASLSLLQATPRTPVSTVLDLGTGSGVQALANSSTAEKVVGTDILPRALELAQATFEVNQLDNITLLQGSWFDPVDGEKFERIVANPPFVVGPPSISHVYRDSGLALDGATKLVAQQASTALATNGIACILGAWVHIDGQPWQSRIADWLSDTGVSAWALQRDVVSPEQYVATWLKDEGLDLRTPEAIDRAHKWLKYFEEEQVDAIGFGWLFLQKLEPATTEVTAETLDQPFSDPLGDEATEYFQRLAWLRDKSQDEILDSRFLMRPTVAVEKVLSADTVSGMGFTTQLYRLTRMDGPRFSHEIDEALYRVLSGLHPEGLPLREVVSLLSFSLDIAHDDSRSELDGEVCSAIVDLIRHGIVLPAGLVEVNK